MINHSHYSHPTTKTFNYMSTTTTATASTTVAPPQVVEDCRGVLKVYNDGSIIRSNKPSFDLPIHDDGSVLWKDIVFDTSHNLQLRLYKPISIFTPNKLPIFYYIHGGGFCIGSRTWSNFHGFCLRLSSQLGAIVVSPDYRLAPEHRLPAAIDDGSAALEWVRAQAVSHEPDEWLAELADFSRVFISGDSAGGNIVHHLANRVGSGSLKMEPVRISGYVLLGPFFGGTMRTKSEIEGPKDTFLNLELIDRYWRLSLPNGETPDHPLANPFGPHSDSTDLKEAMNKDPIPILVIMGENDLLKDRAIDYVMRLREMKKKIEYVEFPGQEHGFFTLCPDSEAAKVVVDLLKNFIKENSG